MRVTKITKKGWYTQREKTEYDAIIELAVSSYQLNTRNRKEIMIDNKHYLVTWWAENIDRFKKYKTLMSLGDLLKVHHATINHLQKHRKPSLRYEENVECIKDFLNS